MWSHGHRRPCSPGHGWDVGPNQWCRRGVHCNGATLQRMWPWRKWCDMAVLKTQLTNWLNRSGLMNWPLWQLRWYSYIYCIYPFLVIKPASWGHQQKQDFQWRIGILTFVWHLGCWSWVTPRALPSAIGSATRSESARGYDCAAAAGEDCWGALPSAHRASYWQLWGSEPLGWTNEQILKVKSPLIFEGPCWIALDSMHWWPLAPMISCSEISILSPFVT